jgi:hypothetical protein
MFNWMLTLCAALTGLSLSCLPQQSFSVGLALGSHGRLLFLFSSMLFLYFRSFQDAAGMISSY